MSSNTLRNIHPTLVCQLRTDRYISHVGDTSNIKEIVICGSGGHGLSTMALLASQAQYKVIGFLDDTKPIGLEIVEGIRIIGGIRNCGEFLSTSTFLALGIGGPWPLEQRTDIYKLLIDKGFSFPALVHPTAVIDSNVLLSNGVQIHANATIRYGTRIGANALINTGAIVEHGCTIGENSVLSPRSLICGNVKVGARTLIGAGAVVLQDLSIGSDVLVGASSLILDNLEDNSYFRGVPGKSINVL
jgi:sugar O-acyltransferase (sialic acid O-acetyltransferase NeuD family)